MLAAGATLVDDLRGNWGPAPGWAVLADPEGNEFCVLRTQAEKAARSPDGDHRPRSRGQSHRGADPS